MVTTPGIAELIEKDMILNANKYNVLRKKYKNNL